MTNEEIARTRKTADLLCSAHGKLRDKFQRRALILDVLLLIASSFLVLHVLADKNFLEKINILGIEYNNLLSGLSILVFILSVLELRVDWKGLAQAHSKSYALYAEVKRELGYLQGSTRLIKADVRRIMSKYDMASELGTNISEKDFLRLKQNHKEKIELSKYLDDHPSASIPLTRLKFLWRDNFGNGKNDSPN